MEERERKSGWYVYVFIGVVIGAALGYVTASQGWLGNEAVGLASNYYMGCSKDGQSFLGRVSTSNVDTALTSYVEAGWDCIVYTHGLEDTRERLGEY